MSTNETVDQYYRFVLEKIKTALHTSPLNRPVEYRLSRNGIYRILGLPDNKTEKNILLRLGEQNVWFTNFDTVKRHENMVLYKKYTPEEFSKYDNYNAINIDKVSEIPMNYKGVMGVPITFVDKYNPVQFELLGIMNAGEENIGIRYTGTPHGRITKDKYEEKRKEYRTKQKEIKDKMNKLHYADEEYYLTSEYPLKLAQNAGKLFESSEAHEKRLLLKMTLQNLVLDGKKARFDWIKPFDQVAFYASRQAWLPG